MHVIEKMANRNLNVCEMLKVSSNVKGFFKMLKVSSVSRAEKLKGEGEAGAAKLMKPRGELNLHDSSDL